MGIRCWRLEEPVYRRRFPSARLARIFCIWLLRRGSMSVLKLRARLLNNLVGTSNSVDELLDLAHKSQEVALNDVCHLAMEKAYQKADSVEDALRFAREAKTMGMDDLSRKAVKELIDDEKEPHELCLLLRSIEPLDFKRSQSTFVEKGD